MAHHSPSVAPPALHPSTAPMGRYPTGTIVRAVAHLQPGAPYIAGEIRGYIFRKDPETGKAVAGDVMLATADGTVFVPVAAIQGRISPSPSAWERRAFVLLLLVLAMLLWWYGTRTGSRA